MAKFVVADATFGTVKSGPNKDSKYMVAKLQDARDLDGSRLISCIIFFGNTIRGNKTATKWEEDFKAGEELTIQGRSTEAKLPYPCYRRLTTPRNGQQVGEIAKDRITGDKLIYTTIRVFGRTAFDEESNTWDYLVGQTPEEQVRRILSSTIDLGGRLVKLYERVPEQTAEPENTVEPPAVDLPQTPSKPESNKVIVGYNQTDGSPIYG